MTSYAFDQRRATAILLMLIRSGLTFDQVELLQGVSDEIDEEIFEITDRRWADQDVPDEIDLMTVSDWDYWHLHIRPEDFS